MFHNLKLLAKIANANVQGKVEREDYISIVYVFIFVIEHDSAAKAFLKMGITFFFFFGLFFFFFLIRLKIFKLSAQEGGMGKCVSSGTDFGSELH